MEITTKQLPASAFELTITVSPADYQSFLEKSAKDISKETKIPGFRPGSAPYDVVKQKFGEEELLSRALNDIVTNTLTQAITEKKIDTFGQPEINVTKMAPGNDLIYTAKFMTLPKVKLADLTSISLKKIPTNVEDKEVDKTINQIAKTRSTEKLIDTAAKADSLVKMDYNISIDNVPQEDGQQKDFSAYLGEKHMVPGFEEQIVGLKANDTKKFDVKFPDNYFQKNFAGKTCTFDVKINGVYELTTPKIDDAFAKSLGKFKDLADLKKQIKDNLTQEQTAKDNRQLEQDLLKKVIEKSTFDELPDKMIDDEVHGMIHELEHDLASKGLNIETWLANMNKTLDQFKKDMRPQAELRAKSALIIKQVAKDENIKIEDKELDERVNQIQEAYKDNQEVLDQIKSPAYKNYMANVMTGQKAMDFLKKKIIKE